MGMKTINLPLGIVVCINNGKVALLSSSDTGQFHLAATGDEDLKGAINGIESLILACACSGVDIESPAFRVAVKTAFETFFDAD